MLLAEVDPDVLAEDRIRCDDLGDCFRVTLRLGDQKTFPLRTCPKSRMAIVLRIKRALAASVRNAGPQGERLVFDRLAGLAAPYFTAKKIHRGNLETVHDLMHLERETSAAILRELEVRGGLPILTQRSPSPDTRVSAA